MGLLRVVRVSEGCWREALRAGVGSYSQSEQGGGECVSVMEVKPPLDS